VSALAETTFDDHRISSRNFKRLSNYIFEYSGIKMPEAKMTMLEGRLRRRLRATGISSFDAYCTYIFDQGGLDEEALHLIDAVTTNKTDFFREPNHFDYLRDKVLPAFDTKGVRNLRVWSSACSVGAEPYTLAMVIADYLEKRSGMDYRILATDLSTDVLQKARRGVYPQDMLEPVPRAMAARYVMASRNKDRGEVRISPKLRSHVGFGRLNLMDTSYQVGEPMHVIFCRNVLIYFDKKTQQEVLRKLCDCLAVGGYLFIGHSESIAGMNLPVRQLANTVFRKD
jgi:chemotaxis protein methyltransferase CheR